MTIRIGINGFGRIGRTVTRILQGCNDVTLVHVNDLAPADQLAHALKYDSVFRKFPGDVELGGSGFLIDGKEVKLTAEKDPANIGWGNLDFVIDATGRFKKREQLEAHISAGAKRVVLAVPPKDALDATIVMGVNEDSLTGDELLVSNASCTTNAAAPVTRVLNDAFTIERGYINTIHAYTNDQRLIDFPHSDWRRSRSATLSIIPTTTGAARAVGKVIPSLDGKLDGTAYRVPVPDGSIVDMLFFVSRDVTVDEVNDVVKKATESSLKGIVEYNTDPIVSSDILANPHSSIFDAPLTQVIDGRMVKVACWYDNEYGYSCRLVDLIRKLAG